MKYQENERFISFKTQLTQEIEEERNRMIALVFCISLFVVAIAVEISFQWVMALN